MLGVVYRNDVYDVDDAANDDAEDEYGFDGNGHNDTYDIDDSDDSGCYDDSYVTTIACFDANMFFSSRRRHTRLPLVSWARRCV